MNHYSESLLVRGSSEAVYAALTTARGLRNWWTPTCDVEEAVGGTATFRFGRTFKTMKIAALRPYAEVRWQCVDSHIDAPALLRRADEWKGTAIHFLLSPASDGGTNLRLEHVGLTPEVECYAMCTAGWRQFLGSLKSYVETGTGHPYVAAETT